MSIEKDEHIIGWKNRFANLFGENTRGADEVTKSGRDKNPAWRGNNSSGCRDKLVKGICERHLYVTWFKKLAR